MKIGIISLFPEMFAALNFGIPRIAQEKGALNISCWNPRDYTSDVHKTVDDTPYGGGPGMVMMFEPLHKAIQAAKAHLPSAKVIYLSPQGKSLDHSTVKRLSECSEMILLCGRYEGIDERLIESEVDEEISIGDYVLSGGEIPAMVIVDACARQLPNVLGDDASAVEDSFVNDLLDYPHYTRPETVNGKTVPEVLLSGHHKKIKRWREKEALGRTWLRRPELLNKKMLSTEEKTLLNEYQQKIVDLSKT